MALRGVAPRLRAIPARHARLFGQAGTAINGAYWRDGSQATEQVLNWLPYSLGSIPPTVPRGYQADRSRQTDQQALAELDDLATGVTKPDNGADAEIGRIRKTAGTRVKTTRSTAGRLSGQKILDVTGKVVTDDSAQAHSYPPPVITDIYGEAVDKRIMYPAEYGSPDMVTDGWYWSATVDSSRPGTYAYTMRIQLHRLVRRNGFTKAGMGMLPIPPVFAPSTAPAAPEAAHSEARSSV